MKPVVVGCRTDNFPENQIETFRQHQPFGMIIFSEPAKKGPDAVKHVVQQFLSACPHGKIFMDAEGGRVNRLKPEFGHGWRDVPTARDFAPLIKTDLNKACEAIYLNAQLIAYDLMALGVDVDCAPVVDLIKEEVILEFGEDGKPHATSASLYQRSYGDDPEIVTQCAKAFADGLHSLGVTSILKHAPGYGRVTADPHYGLDKIRVTLPEMLATDLRPYINMKDYPAVMTAHVIYEDIDPLPATVSPRMMGILRNEVGFEGVIVTDTIEMNSIWPEGFSKTEKCHFGMGLPLPGTLALMTRQSLDAGCDLVMHSDCSRNFQDTLDTLEAAPILSDEKAAWLVNKMTVTKTAADFDRDVAMQRLNALLQP